MMNDVTAWTFLRLDSQSRRVNTLSVNDVPAGHTVIAVRADAEQTTATRIIDTMLTNADARCRVETPARDPKVEGRTHLTAAVEETTSMQDIHE